MSTFPLSAHPGSPAENPARAVVRVPVTTLWIAPDRPREVDAAIVADEPDAASWLAVLDASGLDDASDAEGTGDGRLGLHGRVESQLLAGEPVIITGTDPGGRWSHVLAPWQPTPKSPGGYPGWVPTAHLEDAAEAAGPVARPTADVDAATASADSCDHPAVALARTHLGLRYLWGGLSPLGFDCSGLVHHVWRSLGVVVPRDAYAQAEYARAVELDAVQPGDLYFFGRSGRRIHHVGIVVHPGRMVHASETGRVLVEEDLPADRLDTLVAAGRLPQR